MKGQGSYVPPSYVPIGQSDEEPQDVRLQVNQVSSESSCIGLLCPCYLFAKNAEFLGSGTFAGSCLTHLTLWGLVNAVCCLMTDGILLGLPGCFIACYACNYRKALRLKYNLPEAPCGDFTTHFFCHLCAICQEYREICERSGDPKFSDLNLSVMAAPPMQKMEPALEEIHANTFLPKLTIFSSAVGWYPEIPLVLLPFTLYLSSVLLSTSQENKKMKMRVLLFIFVVMVMVIGDTSLARNLIVPHSQPSSNTLHESNKPRNEFGGWNFYGFKCKSGKDKAVLDYKRVVPNGPNPLHNK
ncbi:hypothetical protein V2J09_018787 [Rumex salicifolius]